MGLKDLLGITKAQRDTELKVAIEKLHFLATEMEKGNDRESDLRFWKEELSVVHRLDNGHSFLLRKTNEAYQILFQVFLLKHGLKENEE